MLADRLALLDRDPDHGPAHQNLGTGLWKQGKPEAALTHYREAFRCRPRSWQLANNLAWIHATHESQEIRNLPEAIRFAELACRLTARRQPAPLGTLAVAYAEAGRYEAARQAARQAIQLAREQGHSQFAEQIQARMQRYPAASLPAEVGNGTNP